MPRRALLPGWRERGTRGVLTHQLNISALTGQGSASGEGVVLRVEAGALQRVPQPAPSCSQRCAAVQA